MLAAAGLISVSVGVLASPHPLRKLPPRLADQVDASTLVCIGVVDQVFKVSIPGGIETGITQADPRTKTEFQFGRVRVERVLKGDPQTSVIFHEAWSTWTCDTTTALTGTRALFFLAPGAVAAWREEDRLKAASALGSELILRNVSSGDGIAPISGDGEHEYVANWGSWPEALLDSDSSERVGKAFSLARVAAYIEALTRFSLEASAVHARCDRSIESSDPFDLRILEDGSRRLATKIGESETVVVDHIDPVKWHRLQTTLRNEAVDIDRVVTKARGWAARTLTLQLDGHRLDFRQDWDQELGDVNEAEVPRLHRALRAWASLWDVLDCPTCTDHRAGDARLMEAR